MLLPAPEPTVDQIGAFLGIVEACLPTPPLVWRIDDEGAIHRVSDPAAWIADEVVTNQYGLLCNGVEHQLVSLCVSDNRSRFTLSEFEVDVRIRGCDGVRRAFELMRELAAAARAFRGFGDTAATGSRIRREYCPGPHQLRLPPAHPFVVEWMNYWSADSCRILGLAPDDPRRSLFFRVEPAGDGVVLQLTDALLDLDIPAHREALDAAYDAFPAIPQWGRAGRGTGTGADAGDKPS